MQSRRERYMLNEKEIEKEVDQDEEPGNR